MSSNYHSLAAGNFLETWSNTARLATNDDWSLVPSIVGYLGDINSGSPTGVDPRTLTGAATGEVDVIVNQANPNTLTNGGVAEFQLADATIALNGSGTADAPSIVLFLDAAGRENITLSVDVRDLDGSTDNAVQPLAVQYRTSETGAWVNVPGGYLADATQGPSLAGNVTNLTVTLPTDANGQGILQVRLLTTNAVSNDEWIGLDNIGVTSTAIDDSTPGRISISDATVVESDTGSQLVFTVDRAGGSGGAATLAYDIGFETADAADLAPGTPTSGIVSFAAGETRKTIVLDVVGDVSPERNERLSVTLTPTSGNLEIVDGVAIGTIVNDDPVSLEIGEIQGRGHRSEYVGQMAVTQGVVTAVDSNGFYLQDATGDGDAATSDAIFVFTRTAPAVAKGDLLEVRGTVQEFSAGAAGLTVTELENATWTKLGTGSVAATVIGTGGRLPPTQTIEDDGLTSYDPTTDGIDFYESLEGMLVTVDDAQAVSNSNEFGETYVVASNGAGATGMNDRGGITIAPGDMNPERLQIDSDSAIFAGYTADHSVGDKLGDVTGVIHYSFNSYELLVTEAVAVVDDSSPSHELTNLDGTADRLTIASYNVENLDPTDGARFDRIAGDIVWNLESPDIIGMQEIQDADGAGSGTNYSGQATADKLIAAIVAAGGPTYAYVEIAPTGNNTTGGEPNGNIRNGYLYDPSRVDYVEGSAELVSGDAFAGTRKPLAAQFMFNEQLVTAINHHATSRLGSDPAYGAVQPPADAGNAARIAQSTAIRAYVDGIVSADPAAKVVVLGDFNGFYFENSLQVLQAGGTLTNLYETLSPEERYSAMFEGNAQGLDNMLVSRSLLDGAQFDVVHINSEQAEGSSAASDHDPLVASLLIPLPNKAPVAADDAIAVDEDASTANLWTTLLGNDSDVNLGDTLSIVSVDTAATQGSVSFDAATQTLVYTADADAFDLLDTGAVATDTLTYTVRDGGGLTSTATVTVSVTGIADGRSINGGNGNDDVSGTGGEDLINAGNGNDVVRGLGGADQLFGGNGNDKLYGGDGIDRIDGGNGADSLFGEAGNDLLAGGGGNDLLWGGGGADVFVFGRGGGHDTIGDFEVGLDQLSFADGIGVSRSRATDANFDGVLDLQLILSNGGGSVVLLDVPSLAELDPTMPIA